MNEELKELEKQISDAMRIKKTLMDYSKTKSVYKQYQKTGYNKNFFKEHEREILLHKQSKQKFEKMGDVSIPSVQELNQTIAFFYNKRRMVLDEYQLKKDELRKVLIIRENVKRILQFNTDEKEKNEMIR